MKIVNIKNSSYEVYIGRGSKWGNPFSNKKNTKAIYKTKSRKESIEKYKDWLLNGNGRFLIEDLHELEGKICGCFCKPKLCHGDILLEILNNKKKSII